MKYQFFSKLSQFGVLSRTDAKNDAPDLQYLLRRRLVSKVSKKGRVFYALTEKSLPLLEDYRQLLLRKASLQHQLTPNDKLYRALLNDLRFLNEKHPEAEAFRFLGDWQLLRPVVSSQLKLSQLRYYREQGLA